MAENTKATRHIHQMGETLELESPKKGTIIYQVCTTPGCGAHWLGGKEYYVSMEAMLTDLGIRPNPPKPRD